MPLGPNMRRSDPAVSFWPRDVGRGRSYHDTMNRLSAVPLCGAHSFRPQTPSLPPLRVRANPIGHWKFDDDACAGASSTTAAADAASADLRPQTWHWQTFAEKSCAVRVTATPFF